MKVNSTIYKGIEYIQVNALPPEQKERLLQTINHELFIKILVDEKLIGNCLLFKDYEIWFDNIYKAQSRISVDQGVKENIKTSVPIEQVRNPEA